MLAERARHTAATGRPLLLLLGGWIQAAPVKLIFDTDMGNDVDDAMALAMIHSLQRRGAVGFAVAAAKAGARVNLFEINFGDASRQFEAARGVVERLQSRLRATGERRGGIPQAGDRSPSADRSARATRRCLARARIGRFPIRSTKWFAFRWARCSRSVRRWDGIKPAPPWKRPEASASSAVTASVFAARSA